MPYKTINQKKMRGNLDANTECNFFVPSHVNIKKARLLNCVHDSSIKNIAKNHLNNLFMKFVCCMCKFSALFTDRSCSTTRHSLVKQLTFQILFKFVPNIDNVCMCLCVNGWKMGISSQISDVISFRFAFYFNL